MRKPGPSAFRWRLANGRVRVSNAWYRTAGNRIHGGRQGYRNWLNRRAVLRGRSPLPERLTRPVRSSLPVYRDRINPATGRPHRDDRALGRTSDASLSRLAPQRQRDAQAARQREMAGDRGHLTPDQRAARLRATLRGVSPEAVRTAVDHYDRLRGRER